MKDYDDLWRMSQSEPGLDRVKLKKLLKTRVVPANLDVEWISPEMERYWVSHRKKYQDLPEELEKLFESVNKWLVKTKSK